MARVRVKVTNDPKVIEVSPEQLIQNVPEPIPTTHETNTPEPVTSSVQSSAMPSEPQTISKNGITLSKRALIGMASVSLILVFFLSAILISKNHSSGQPKTLGSATQETEAQSYYNAVSKIVELPTDELPTVANVADAQKVKEQNSVLTDVKDGDKMLFFAKARKVVVYRPSSQKVVAAVSLAQPDATTQTQKTN